MHVGTIARHFLCSQLFMYMCVCMQINCNSVEILNEKMDMRNKRMDLLWKGG